MLIASKMFGGRQAATKGTFGLCPVCGEQVIPKCGTQKIHHWAHKAKSKCKHTSKETEWHRQWKSRFPIECQEVKVGESNRADVKLPNGRILEFQNSPISAEKVQQREQVYGSNLVWVVNAERFHKNLIRESEDQFRWLYFKTPWRHARNLFLHNVNSLTSRKLNWTTKSYGRTYDRDDWEDTYREYTNCSATDTVNEHDGSNSLLRVKWIAPRNAPGGGRIFTGEFVPISNFLRWV